MNMVEVKHEATGDIIRVCECDLEQMHDKGWHPLEHNVNPAADEDETETE